MKNLIEYENLGKLNAPYQEKLQNAFHEVLKSGWFVLGNQVTQFEQEFAQYIGTKYCKGVASGLDALILGLKALDLPPASEILVPSNTYIATILAILQLGHKPILVEPDLKTYNIDPLKIRQKITPRTNCIVLVHLYGKCCAMDEIMQICQEHKLFLIEDCAQSHGASFKQKKSGTFGHIGAFSFYPTKNLGALGDAGAITTDSAELAEKIAILRNYGSQKKYYNEVIGFNSRLDEVQAAFLRVKLAHLDQINAHKRNLAKVYFENLSPSLIQPVTHPDYFDVFHIFNIRHPKRDQLKIYLEKNGIKTEIHYPVSPHQQEAMKGILDHELCPLSEEIHQTTLSLPISSIHSADEVRRVCEVINGFTNEM
jgi:dTDP-4-amino-4,6-dideoxygalactose transaminase